MMTPCPVPNLPAEFWTPDTPPAELQRVIQLMRHEHDDPPTLVPWRPFPGKPQEAAYYCGADELFFAGAAGPGKTALLVGLALTRHRKSIIFRREYTQLRAIIDYIRELVPAAHGSFNGQDHVWRINDGRTIELGAVQFDHDVERYQGRPHDFLGFDELPTLSQKQYRFLIGWNRTSDPDQRCRVVAAGNPPLNPEDRWVIEEWAPWLDDKFPDPAVPGEPRWYAMLKDQHGERRLVWLKTGDPIHEGGEVIIPRSRTFIPGRVDDNPILIERGYKSVLQSFPEPLRSQLLFGDMRAGTQDNPWQVIPTAWVRAAMARWTPDAPEGPASAIGIDPARGGSDKTVFAPRWRTYWGKLLKYPGITTPDSPSVVARLRLVLGANRDVRLCIDVIGIGAAVYDACLAVQFNAAPINFAEGHDGRDSTGQVEFKNVRAWSYWHMREVLDPANPLRLKSLPQLPDDPELLADLCAARYKHTPGGIVIEKKEEIQKRIGRSPDCGDSVVLSLLSPRAPAVMEPRRLRT